MLLYIACLTSAASPMFKMLLFNYTVHILHLVFLKLCLKLVRVKPNIIKSVFSWHRTLTHLVTLQVRSKSDVIHAEDNIMSSDVTYLPNTEVLFDQNKFFSVDLN